MQIAQGANLDGTFTIKLSNADFQVQYRFPGNPEPIFQVNPGFHKDILLTPIREEHKWTVRARRADKEAKLKLSG